MYFNKISSHSRITYFNHSWCAICKLVFGWITSKYIEAKALKTSVETTKALSKIPKNSQQANKKLAEYIRVEKSQIKTNLANKENSIIMVFD